MNFIIELPLFYCSVMFSIGEDNQQILVPLKEYLLEEDFERFKSDGSLTYAERQEGSCIMLCTGLCLVRMNKPPENPSTIAVLAHELVHAASYILVSKNMVRNPETEEVVCYLVQYLTEQVLERVKPNKK